MPQTEVIKQAKRYARQGKSLFTQAGEFVRDEIKKFRQGDGGVRSVKQAIAVGLSEARKAGIKVPATWGKKIKKSPKKSSIHVKQNAAQHRPTKRHRAAMKAAHTRQQHAR
jgi:hypothetical protein